MARGGGGSRPLSVGRYFTGLMVFWFIGNAFWLSTVRQHGKLSPIKSSAHEPHTLHRQPESSQAHDARVDPASENTLEGFDFFRSLALELAALPPKETVDRLRSEDPFEVRRFEEQLLQEETQLGRILEPVELEKLFPCPKQRITLPDIRNMTAAENYRQGTRGWFIFFQHLRKAGGTQFCSLASENIPRRRLPRYYCMPDYHWNDTVGSAGSLHHYNNEVIAQHMYQDNHAIAGNEWDSLDRRHHFNLPAVFVTSFRKPLDRALSQYRFECVEDRGCTAKSVEQYWGRRRGLYNVYTTTFADPDLIHRGAYRVLEEIYVGTSEHAATQRRQLMSDALDALRRFHVVTSLEFLVYAEQIFQQVLGFEKTSSVRKRVRPHIQQAQRHDGQGENKLGAAGIQKASWNPETYLSKELYQRMSDTLALDEILNDMARRMFLERLVCHQY